MIDNLFDINDYKLINRFIYDYLYFPDKVCEFYKNHYKDINSYKLAIDTKHNNNCNRKIINKVLIDQYKKFNIHKNVYNNINKLLDDNTYTITTGHQPMIFSGYLYFIYKIISTINLAKLIEKQYPQYNIVPVFWLANEDHNISNINNINIENINIKWHLNNNNQIVGSLNPNSLCKNIFDIKNILGNNNNDLNYICDIFYYSYSNYNTISDSTRYFVNELFGEYGLIIIDGNNTILKKSFQQYIKKDIIDNISNLYIKKTTDKINFLGYNHIKYDNTKINFYYLNNNFRYEIYHKKDNLFLINKKQYSYKALDKEITKNTERFSPNVYTRPLYQEFILPNIAYIGGYHEVSYWLQLKDMFEFYNINYPIIALRQSIFLLSYNKSKKISNLNLRKNDFINSPQIIFKKICNINDVNLEYEKKILVSMFDTMVKKFNNNRNEIILTSKLFNKYMSKLEKKLIKKQKNIYSCELNQIKNIKNQLFPNNIIQERYNNIIPYYKKYGKKFIDTIIQKCNILDKFLLFITLSNKK